MKIAGQTIAMNTTVPVVAVARGDKELVLECGTVTKEHWDAFDKLVPEPVMPNMLVRGKDGEQPDPTNEYYLEAMDKYREQRYQYTVLCSLLYTNGLVFDTVNMDKPETWTNVFTELAEAGVLVPEINRIVSAIYEAQGITQDKVDKALDSFYQRQKEVQAQLSADA